MASLRVKLFVLCIICIILDTASSYPEQGLWDFELDGKEANFQTIVVTKSMFNKGIITASVQCNPLDKSEDFNITVTWYLRKATCWREYYESDAINSRPDAVLKVLEKNSNTETSIYTTGSETIACDGTLIYLSTTDAKSTTEGDFNSELKQNDDKMATPKVLNRRRRNLPENSTSYNGIKDTASKSNQLHIITKDGIFQFIIGSMIQNIPSRSVNQSYTANLHLEMYSDYGYLSAADYPLLIFYNTMCVIYVIYGVGWLVVSFMRWRELLRVQYWIGAVILLGMLEKAIFTAEYESVNEKGVSIPGLIVFAELVSCAKRTLSRMLIIIVSFGFGIVKPRLGVVLHRVIGVGVLYFLLASIEGCMRALRPRIHNNEYSRRVLFAIIPLALLESAICWWVFSALVSTTRTLRLRRNTIKLDLFKHFTNTLVFAVVTSVIFMLWSIKYQNFDTCLSDWKQLWVNDAFWHVLFVIILLVIMILWRPTNNNQRFAFSPLLDEGSDCEDEEETEKLMSNIGENMKYRNQRNSSSSSSPKVSHSLEDDLKWVEENIPSSLADTGIPILDSDEEIVTTRFEISKMQ